MTTGMMKDVVIKINPVDQGYKVCYSLADVFMTMADEVLNRPVFVSKPRDMECKEILDFKVVCIDGMNNHFCNPARVGDVNKYLAKEMMLYFAGRNDAAGFIDASAYWKRLQMPDGTINSAYGNLLFVKKNKHGITQFDFAKQALLKDKDTRQAVMFLASPDYQFDGNPDFVCTFTYHFFIRDNILCMIVNRRSQDLIRGFTYDAVWEMALLQAMRLELLEKYPDLNVGWISWNINSLHIYSEHYEMVEKMLQNKFTPIPLPQMKSSPIMVPFTDADPFQRWCIQNAGLAPKTEEK